MTTTTTDPIAAAKELRARATEESEKRFRDAVRRHVREPLQPAEIVRVCAVTDRSIDAFAEAVSRRKEIIEAKSLVETIEERRQAVSKARELLESTKLARVDKVKELNIRYDGFVSKRRSQLADVEARLKVASDAQRRLQEMADSLVTEDEQSLRRDAAELHGAIVTKIHAGRHLTEEQIVDLRSQHDELQAQLDELAAARMEAILNG